ncbi:ABC transporter ATP-binding protein [Mesorhizobium sp. M8A.F.Ca.ET.161.01.1.1]|nr:MAG: ABC transporter ATP-binding protein [Mesorhizobium sp.]TGR28029.1 ABC transporter ATP-binding protein [Mesorhizobium sp. M8A.F.Ca.ET.197.01.1.1]TGR32432.1 ABC transporter ATP-binding protein [Mesorhizobium sp. M8A.F.Ca.ET.202.01.1.1]TGR43699.1 ABC transporter ATP-binding protein [bacterium M00.F.Ca.ET.199.01.1.1]TGR53004.1 ABC transporter ATP-binding protein [Mesorhizobium sp. M8A.F.Ca.ET.198.01.1.1]TGT87394.1 ABC transporter ATP-binding protein [Mesorhizobium sp. M8A.F.Ca.ET.161.01.1.
MGRCPGGKIHICICSKPAWCLQRKRGTLRIAAAWTGSIRCSSNSFTIGARVPCVNSSGRLGKEAQNSNPKGWIPAICASGPGYCIDIPTLSIQAQITALLKRICRDRGTAVMLVTHDMGVIAETADRVAVMYAGRIVEIGPVDDIIRRPQHPYTRGLIGSIPSLVTRHERLVQIDGAMPRLNSMPPGCAFHPRCVLADTRCRTALPPLQKNVSGMAACWTLAAGNAVEAA